MKRVPEVIDCWFDSGAMPFAQYHYPFENKEYFESHFPADFISEAVDQTRGWFYSLLAISTLIFNKAPYKNVIVLGHVQDKDGKKMSKSKGNAVDPFKALEKFGADAIRWYFYTNSAPWLPNRFHDDAVTEGQRKFLGTLWNTYAFYVLYANIDSFNPKEHTLNKEKLSVMDRWLLSKMNTMVKTVDEELDGYHIPEAARALDNFVDEMSNWYVRRCRERFWGGGMTDDKVNAYMTLYTALVHVAKAAAPMIPFMAEEIYQNLVRSIDPDAPESVHLCNFPVCDDNMVDPALEDAMEEVLRIVILGRAARNGANMKNRQPLASLRVAAEHTLDKIYTDIIQDELNVKEVLFIDNADSLLSYTFKPQLKTVGPKFGKKVGEIRNALAAANGSALKKELDQTGCVQLSLSDGEAVLAEEDLLVETKQSEGLYTLSDNGVTVALDTVITPALEKEGFAREMISKIQTMRKEAGFEVTDHIRVTIAADDKLQEQITPFLDEICRVVLAEELTFAEPKGYVKQWDINKEEAVIGVEKLS